MTGYDSERFRVAGLPCTLAFAGHSHRGAVRRINEDSLLMSPPVFAIADGMGGHSHGDRASRAAVDAFASAFGSSAPARPEQVLKAIERANDDVVALATSADHALPGTTLVGVALVQVESTGGYHWMAFNVGDSRVYSWDGRSLQQLSVDHSVVQELVDAGLISSAEAEGHPERNVVTRALGATIEVDADVWLLPASGRQTFLLCSDGLTKELSDDAIAEIIVFHDGQSALDEFAPTLPQRLVDAAIAAGGSDNVSVVIVSSEFDNAEAHMTDETADALPRHLEETLPRRHS